MTVAQQPRKQQKSAEFSAILTYAARKRIKNFIKYIPVMHKYGFALEFINRYGWLSEAYARTIVQSGIIQDAEPAILSLERPNLLYYIHKTGHQWSETGKKEIHQKHPVTYRHFFG